MRFVIATAALVSAILLGQANTPAPRVLPYQGRLLGADGTPQTGSVRLTFRIYATALGGTPIWSEAQSTQLTNGFYAVFLGSISTFPEALFDGHDRWLGVSVEDGPELTPRQQIASVAYAITATNAYRAAQADKAASADTAGYATTAGTASTAARATLADRATTADTAVHTSRADSAITADTANTATNLSGTGEITARSVHSTGTITVDQGLSAASITTTPGSGNVSVGGNLYVGGQVSGPFWRIVGMSSGVQTDGSWSRASCKAVGAGMCTTVGVPGCDPGVSQDPPTSWATSSACTPAGYNNQPPASCTSYYQYLCIGK